MGGSADMSGSVASERGGPRRVVLLVDDNDILRPALVRLLGTLDVEVLATTSGEEALAAASARRGPIDLLLTDVVMPGISGSELADRLQRARPDLKVLFMSGYPDHADVSRAMARGGAAIVEKPFRHAALVDEVRRLLS